MLDIPRVVVSTQHGRRFGRVLFADGCYALMVAFTIQSSPRRQKKPGNQSLNSAGVLNALASKNTISDTSFRVVLQ